MDGGVGWMDFRVSDVLDVGSERVGLGFGGFR